MASLDQIETIIVVILENRSFDHALGYLSLPGKGRMPVEGLSDDPDWLAPRANVWNGNRFEPFRLAKKEFPDPPHDRKTIEMQIGKAPKKGSPPPMDGFVESYMTRDPKPDDPSVVMGYYTETDVPIFDFFARNFVVCDHWFASLPTGTQPNRLMAMSGTTRIVDNAVPIPDQELVYDWLTQRNVRWAVYHSGDFFPFFSIMNEWMDDIAGSILLRPKGDRGRFRLFANFAKDWKESPTMPQVIFIEPEYTDAPHDRPNDDHPPTSITEGQKFLRDIYLAVTSNSKRWARTMMIVTYDEHGGFYDHVPPLPTPTTIKTAEGWSTMLPTTGVRVPSFVISPLVDAGAVLSEPLDHTSILQLLAEKFDGGASYSPEVTARQSHFSRLSTSLARRRPRATPVPPQVAPGFMSLFAVANPRPSLDENENRQAFRLAASRLLEKHPALAEHGLARFRAET